MNISKLLIFLVSLLLLTCTNKNEKTIDKTFMVICFDVEDYTSPESVGMDDIPKWLAETMTEEGVTGSFFVIGEKARSMAERGRTDVIEAMAKHDIGSHTNYGSIHPTVTEILEYATWEEGTSKMLLNETAGFNDLERIFGQRPVALARHGGSYGPQLVSALSQMSAGYVYSPISLPGHNAVWFCNTLNFHGEGNFGFFDDNYYRDDLFNPMLDDLNNRIPKAIENVEVVSFFANHPSKVRSIQFWDFNYYKGANPGPDEWKTPELRPLESMKIAQKNFRRLIQFLKNRDDIELTTYRDLMKRFSYQKEDINKEELEKIALRIVEEKAIVIDDYYSPAEVFTALSSALSNYLENGQLPEKVGIERPFGPTEMPSQNPEVDEITKVQALELTRLAYDYVKINNRLPHALSVNDKKIGAGSLLALFSEMYIAINNGKMSDNIQVLSFAAYPAENEENIIKKVQDCKGWPVHREDIDMSHLVEMTKMQLWTLKPAFAR